jgi:hypothetical protein
MARPFWVAVRVAVPVAFWVAIRNATSSDAESPCTAPVWTVPFSGRQGSGLSKRVARGIPRVRGRPDGHDSLKGAAWMPRPFWVPFWVPFWDPFWRPIRTGSPCAAETPCTVRRSDVRSSARQPSGLRRCSERGTVSMPGTPCGRRLARVVDRWSHARPANRPDAGEEVWR